MKTFGKTSIGMALTAAVFAAGAALAEGAGTSERRSLTLAYPAEAPLKDPVQVELSLEGTDLKARFYVNTPSINARETLGPDQYPYQFDVVEIFVSVEGLVGQGPFPYFEAELSPYGQTLSVKVESLKKPFVDGFDFGLRHSVTRLSGGSWIGEMVVPLNRLGWDGDPAKIVGNAYAILGPAGARTFWGLTLPRLKKPNFHQPQYFKALVPSGHGS